MADGEIPPLYRAYGVVRLLELPALLLGGVAAAFGHRWGGVLLLADVVVQIGAHVIVGRAEFRDTMTRAWPTVAALPDDEWDD